MRAMDMTMDTGYRHYPAAHPPEHVVKRLPERLVVRPSLATVSPPFALAFAGLGCALSGHHQPHTEVSVRSSSVPEHQVFQFPF